MKASIGLAALLGLGALASALVWLGREPAERTSTRAVHPDVPESVPEPIITTETASEPMRETGPAASSAERREPAVPVASSAATTLDEASLMAKLHDLGQRDPEQSIRLGREGNQRFPNGTGASERAWIVCKSLSSLGRSDEAHAEATKMVKDYPGTSWTLDVIKHVLIHPGTHPAQRGYGK